MLEAMHPNSSAGITWGALLTEAGLLDERVPYGEQATPAHLGPDQNKNNNKGSNVLRIVVENLLQHWIKSMWTLGCKVQRYHGGNKVG